MSQQKKVRCTECSKLFATDAAANQHFMDVHVEKDPRKLSKNVRRMLAQDVFGDLSDGAFFAAAESEFGLSVDDWAD